MVSANGPSTMSALPFLIRTVVAVSMPWSGSPAILTPFDFMSCREVAIPVHQFVELWRSWGPARTLCVVDQKHVLHLSLSCSLTPPSGPSPIRRTECPRIDTVRQNFSTARNRPDTMEATQSFHKSAPLNHGWRTSYCGHDCPSLPPPDNIPSGYELQSSRATSRHERIHPAPRRGFPVGDARGQHLPARADRRARGARHRPVERGPKTPGACCATKRN